MVTIKYRTYVHENAFMNITKGCLRPSVKLSVQGVLPLFALNWRSSTSMQRSGEAFSCPAMLSCVPNGNQGEEKYQV